MLTWTAESWLPLQMVISLPAGFLTDRFRRDTMLRVGTILPFPLTFAFSPDFCLLHFMALAWHM